MLEVVPLVELIQASPHELSGAKSFIRYAKITIFVQLVRFLNTDLPGAGYLLFLKTVSLFLKLVSLFPKPYSLFQKFKKKI